MHGYVVPSRIGTFACTTLQLEFSIYSGKKSCEKICKKPGINKQRWKKKVVNVLGCERSEPGFESRRPESDITSTHQKNGGKISNPSAATSTVSSDNYNGPGPNYYTGPL